MLETTEIAGGIGQEEKTSELFLENAKTFQQFILKSKNSGHV